MPFLTPLFLLGAFAVGVPIYLHLVHRERTKRTPFASLMFLRRIPIKELRRRRLSHIFLLFLRCLGLLLLVAAFARPVVSGLWWSRVNPLLARSVVILLDHSLSMSAAPVWERALQAAQEKVASLGDEDEGLIIQFGELAEVLSLWEPSSEKLREILRQRAAPSFESTSYVEGFRVAVDQLQEAKNGRKEIYLITDFQMAGMAGTGGWKVPDDIFVEVNDVGGDEANLFIEEVRLERDVFTAQYPHAILARLRSTSDQPSQGEAQLFLEGKLISRSTFETQDQQAVNITFKAFELEPGVSRGKIVVEPADDLAADNTFHFVLERQEPRRVLVLQSSASRSGFYLESALSSGQNLPFNVDVSTASALGKIDPSETPLIVLNDLSQPPRRSTFEAYLNAGGGIIVVLSNNVQAQAYNRDWGALLPVHLEDRNFVRRQNKPFTSITEVNWEHPIFRIFQDLHRAAIASTQFYSYWRVRAKPEASVLARFSEGDPALVEGSAGAGKVLVFASSLDPVWNDFPLHSSYVPFWYRSAQYAAGWEARPAALRVNRTLPVGASEDSSDSGSSGTWNLIDPRGERVLGLDEDKPEFVSLKLPGHYEVRSNKKTDWVAVNPPPEESDLTRIAREDFQAVFIPRDSRLDETGSQEGARQETQEQQLWWLFLTAAVAVFLVEWLVANRSRPRPVLSQPQ